MNETNDSNALMLVHERNLFYQKKFYLSLGMYALSWIVVGILAAVLIYMVKNPTHPLYFVADNVGRLIQEAPLSQKNMSNEEVASWVVNAVQETYSYDYVNYRSQLQNAQKYFTDYGWSNYKAALAASNNLVALTQRKMVVFAKISGPPELLNEGVLGGQVKAYAWKFQMPVLVNYMIPPYSEKSGFKNPLRVTVIVQRQSLLQSYKGLGIVQMNAVTDVTNTAPQQLVAPT